MTTCCKYGPEQGQRPQDREEANADQGSWSELSEAVCLVGGWGRGHSGVTLAPQREQKAPGAGSGATRKRLQLHNYARGAPSPGDIPAPPGNIELQNEWVLFGFAEMHLNSRAFARMSQKQESLQPHSSWYFSIPSRHYITGHIFRNLVLAAEPSGLNFQLPHPQTFNVQERRCWHFLGFLLFLSYQE